MIITRPRHLLVAGMTILSGCLMAQDVADSPDSLAKARHEVEINAGAIHNRVIDEGFTASKLKFTGNTPAFQATYRRTGEKIVIHAGLYAAFGKVRTADQRISSRMYQYRISASVLRPLFKSGTSSSKIHLFIGGELSSMIYMRYDEKQIYNVSAMFIHGLYVHALGQLDLNSRSSISAELFVPGLLFTRYVAADGGANVDLKPEADHPLELIFNKAAIASPVPFPYLRCKFGYSLKLSQRVSFAASYEFSRLRDQSEGTLRAYGNQILTGFKFHF
ncbi:MAG TPA: hypothetical protein VK508_19695 [Cyclobacteriaceae bacterium]|nr:hypothetical protein [Cyclobacteriaceae bacterium]